MIVRVDHGFEVLDQTGQRLLFCSYEPLSKPRRPRVLLTKLAKPASPQTAAFLHRGRQRPSLPRDGHVQRAVEGAEGNRESAGSLGNRAQNLHLVEAYIRMSAL